jgi:hypothetical protein
MRDVARIIAAGCAATTLAGCALLAGYDFGKYREEHDGLGGSGGAGATGSSHAIGSTSSGQTGTGGATGQCADAGTGKFGAPTPLTSGNANPFSIANDQKFVYWTADGAMPGPKTGIVYGMTKDDLMSRVVAQVQSFPRSLQVDDTNLYWLGHEFPTTSEIWKIDKTAVGAMPFPIWSVAPGIVNDIAVWNKILYFSYESMGVYELDVVANQYQRSIQNSIGRTPKALTADATGVYYVEEPAPLVPGQTNIMKFDPVTKIGVTVAMGEDGVGPIVVAGPNVYWSSSTGIRAASQLGGAPPVIVSNTLGPCAGLATDGTYLYCTLAKVPAMLVVLLGTNAPGTFAVGATTLHGVTAGCDAVYFIADMGVAKISK